MKYSIVKLEQLSGSEATIYSLLSEETSQTLFEQFILENEKNHAEEIKDIILRLRTIGAKTGARETFFKTKEGIPGDMICALYDRPDKNLRLYCMRIGNLILILGGGGLKQTRTLQEDPKLKEENYLMRAFSEAFYEKRKDRELFISDDGTEIEGDLDFLL